MKRDNINGALPQKVTKPTLAEKLAKGIINVIPSKYRDMAQGITQSIFEKINDLETYSDETSVKQIDLILGRIESLLDTKLNELSTNQQEELKAELLNIIQTLDKIKPDLKAEFETLIKLLLNESIESLKASIREILFNNFPKQNKPEEVPQSQNQDTVELFEEVEQYKEDLILEAEADKEKIKAEFSDKEQEFKTELSEKDKEIKQNNKQSLLNTNIEQQPVDDPKAKKIRDKKLKKEFNDMKNFISTQLNLLHDNLLKSMSDVLAKQQLGAKKQAKKDKAPMDQMIEMLEQINQTVNKIYNFFETLGERILLFIEKSIRRIAIALGKAIFVIALPLVALFWMTVGPVLSLIAYGVFLILKAVSENAPLFAEAISKMMTTMAEAVPIIASAVPRIIGLFEKILDIVLKIVDFFIGELWTFIKNELWVFIKNSIWPAITGLISWLQTEVWEPVLKPILIWLSTTFLTFIENVIMPVIGRVLNWIMDTLIPFITQYVAPVIVTILEVLNEFLLAIKPWINPLVDIVFSTLVELFTILKPVIVQLAQFLANVFMDILTGLKAAWDFTNENVIKPLWSFLTEIVPNFASWIWNKIKSILPWGDNDEAVTKVSEINTLEEYQKENQRLRDQIEELGGWNKEEALQKQQKALEKARNDTIKIDKGSIYDLIQLVEQIDVVVRELLVKTVKLLESLCNYIEKNLTNTNNISNIATVNVANSSTTGLQTSVENSKFDTAEQTIATDNITNQIVSTNINAVKNIDNTLNPANAASKMELTNNTVNDNIKRTAEQNKRDLNNKSNSIMEFLAEQFGLVMKKLDEPITSSETNIVPITPIENINSATFENEFDYINTNRFIKIFN